MASLRRNKTLAIDFMSKTECVTTRESSPRSACIAAMNIIGGHLLAAANTLCANPHSHVLVTAPAREIILHTYMFLTLPTYTPSLAGRPRPSSRGSEQAN